MHHQFELGHNSVEAIKNICCMKEEDAIDLSTVTRWSKKFCSGCKKLNDQARSGRHKPADFEAVLQNIDIENCAFYNQNTFVLPYYLNS